MHPSLPVVMDHELVCEANSVSTGCDSVDHVCVNLQGWRGQPEKLWPTSPSSIFMLDSPLESEHMETLEKATGVMLMTMFL